MNEPALPPRPTFWTGRRLAHTFSGMVAAAIVAGLVGIPLGMWIIFQPASQVAVGPVSIYLAGAGIFAIAAGWWAGRRVYMIDSGFGDPGRGMIVFLAAMAVASVAVWGGSAAATAHVPDASARLTRTVLPVQAQPTDQSRAGDAPLRPLNTIPGSVSHSCGAGTARACSNLLFDSYNTAVGFKSDVDELCRTIREAGRDGELMGKCDLYQQGVSGSPNSMRARLATMKVELTVVAEVVGLPPLELE